MPTPSTLPIQVSGASAGPSPSRANQNGKQEGVTPFSQTLSREMEQRAPAPARQADAPKPQQAQADKAPEAKPAQNEPARQADAKAEGKDTSSGDAASAQAAADQAADTAADAAAAAAPVVDMLALVASFNQPVQVAATGKAAPAADTLAVSAAAAPAAELPVAATVVATSADDGFADALAAGTAALPAAATASAAAATDSAPVKIATATVALPDGAATFKDAATLQAGQAAPAVPAAPSAVPTANEGKGAHRVDGKIALPEASSQVNPGDAAAAAPRAQGQGDALPKVAAEAAQLHSQRAERSDAPLIKDIAAAAAPVAAPVQQAALNVAQAVANGAGDKLAARVGTPGWDNQLGQKIVWMVAGKEQSATLTLNPPDMGPMQVVLSVNNDQATVNFTAHQPEVRQALEEAMPRLREMLDASGISLGNASVNAGTPGQDQAQQGSTPGQQGHARGLVMETNGSAADAATRQAARRPAAGNGLVDTFA